MKEERNQKSEVRPLMSDFEDLFYCRSCRKPVRIRVPAGVSAFMTLRFVDETLGGLCPACLAKEKRN